jgi:hypothetical protein
MPRRFPCEVWYPMGPIFVRRSLFLPCRAPRAPVVSGAPVFLPCPFPAVPVSLPCPFPCGAVSLPCLFPCGARSLRCPFPAVPVSLGRPLFLPRRLFVPCPAACRAGSLCGASSFCCVALCAAPGCLPSSSLCRPRSCCSALPRRAPCRTGLYPPRRFPLGACIRVAPLSLRLHSFCGVSCSCRAHILRGPRFPAGARFRYGFVLLRPFVLRRPIFLSARLSLPRPRLPRCAATRAAPRPAAPALLPRVASLAARGDLRRAFLPRRFPATPAACNACCLRRGLSLPARRGVNRASATQPQAAGRGAEAGRGQGVA